MSDIVQKAPRFTEADAARIARELYDLSATARLLPSERDQNFRLTPPGGPEYVLKLANADETRDVLDFQNQALGHIARRRLELGLPKGMAPELVPTRAGDAIGSTTGPDGQVHLVRLLTWLDGKPLALARPHDEALLTSLGDFFGHLDRALEGLDHPAAHRVFHWDLKHAGQVVAERMEHVTDPTRRGLIQRLVDRYQTETAPLISGLPVQVIHSDGNDYNILVHPDGPYGLRVSGVIDFGDMVSSQRVNDIAITLAYAMMGKKDPLAAARFVVAGCHRRLPLLESELAVLFDLIRMRLATSVCQSAYQYHLRPDNEYLRISEKPAWDLLERLEAIHPRVAHYTFRAACGLEPVAGSARIAGWIKEKAKDFAPIMAVDFRSEKPLILDLSVASPLIGAGLGPQEPENLVEPIRQAMAEAGTPTAVGGYGQARFLYWRPAFAVETDLGVEYRSIHMGLDVFAPAETPVFAFTEGRIHGFTNNAGRFDYGPTVILEHRTGRGDRFYSLYAHLTPGSLALLEPGQPVRRGQPLGRVGHTSDNGGWPPHVHFQIITDLLDETSTFPGAARPSQWDVWKSLSPDPSILVGLSSDPPPGSGRSRDEIQAVRRRTLGRNLSISYRRPLKIVRGRGPWLFDDSGQPFLDCVNNVCHVGHAHPHVVAAGQRQMNILNTNTRYLHDHIVDYAQRLLATFPAPLRVVYFVCSGSEANELALRLARTYTGQKHLITLDGAYHGNTQGLIDISPYKHNGPGGSGRPPWVQMAMMPCGYRGPHKGFGPDVGARYALYVKDAADRIQAENAGPAAFIAESMLGCGGQVVLPEGYLAEAARHVRAAGGLLIADEVQVGFGRAGTHFWAFETQGVIPDIVTLGKPMGNGHPLAAVVTTEAIADAFNNGMEYFNTFGGNPVSCAIGMAVLDVIEREKLQHNALRTGQRLLKGFTELMTRHPLIGHVRGLGLYAGAELVRDRETLEPAADEASHICNRLRDYGILMSTDGPLHNVLKLKPPIVFTNDHVDRVLTALDEVLSEDRLKRY